MYYKEKNYYKIKQYHCKCKMQASHEDMVKKSKEYKTEMRIHKAKVKRDSEKSQKIR